MKKPNWLGSLNVDKKKKYDVSNIVALGSDQKSVLMSAEELALWLEQRYCGDLSVEFDHIQSPEQRQWILQEMEGDAERNVPTQEDRLRAASLMRQSEVLDSFLHVKFPSLKRYSLEGCEAALAGIWAGLDESAAHGVNDVVIGMAHRGRTNLLVGLLQYPASLVMHKIRGHSDVPHDVPRVTGDVMSHIGHLAHLKSGQHLSSRVTASDVQVRVLHNPSHLEAVNPVALGRARARGAMAFLIHGDAALAGQGVNYEACQMTKLKHFSCGGALHMVVNNQIGFTAEAEAGRTGRYATDLFKAFEIPIWRASNPDAVLRAARMAARYRARFHDDAVVDVVGFRRYGHNELDEPSFTNPLMYRAVESKGRPGEVYVQELQRSGVDTSSVEGVVAKTQQYLESEYALTSEANSSGAPGHVAPAMTHLESEWVPYVMQRTFDGSAVATSVAAETLLEVGRASVAVAPEIKLHKTLERTMLEGRTKKLQQAAQNPDEKVLDWATAEALAIGSLAKEGYAVRLCGQDSGRGTFSHRHFEFTCQNTGKRDVPLSRVGRVEPVNSFLSELAVLSFEYGYSIDSPKQLCIWESQYGDFFNQAQVAVDTFISSSHEKWQRPTAITMALPHGYDGTGPEHSSARIERFLQMGNDSFLSPDSSQVPNWRVVNPTTPANVFHALRRQLLSSVRIPLIYIAPKGILRHPQAVSSLRDLSDASARFQPVIAELEHASTAQTVLWCSGKTYFDLVAERERRKLPASRVAIVRLEELLPFPFAEITRVAQQFKAANRHIWCQEEHENMGAWTHVYPRFYHAYSGHPLLYAGRGPLATPAVGVSDLHKAEVKAYYDAAFKDSEK